MVSALLYFGHKHAFKPREAQIERDRQTDKGRESEKEKTKGNGRETEGGRDDIPSVM